MALEHQPTNADIEAVYGSLYKVIGDCNFFFEQVAKWENNIVDDDEYEIVADAFDEMLDDQEYDELVSEEDLDD